MSSRGRCTHTDSCTHIKQLESGVQQGALYTYRLLHSYQTAGVRSPAGGAVHIQTAVLISNSWSQESSRGRCTHTDSCTHIKQLESGVQQGALYTYRLLHSYQTAGVRSPAGGAVHIQTAVLISNSWSQESSRGRCTHTDSCTHIKQLESGVQQGALYTYRLLYSYQTAGVRSPAGGAVHIQNLGLISNSWSQESSRGAVHIQTLALISNSWSQESSRGRCTHTDSCTHIKQLESGVQQGALYTYRLLHSYQTAGVRSPAGGAVHIQNLGLISNSWSQESSRGAVHIQTLALISNSWSQESSRGAVHIQTLALISNSWSQESSRGAVHIQTLALISNSWSQVSSRGRCTPTDSCTHIKQLESGVQQGALYTYRLLHSYQTAGVRSPAGALYTYRLLHSYQTAGVRSPAGGAVHLQTLALISNSWSQESSRGRCTPTDSCTHIKQLESGVQQGRCTPTDSCTHIKQLESGVQQGALYTYRLLHSYQTAGVRGPAGGAVHLQTLALISNSWSQESSRGRCTHTDSCTHIKQLESGVQQGALYTYRLLYSYQTARVRSPARGAVHIQTSVLTSDPSPAAETRSHASDSAGDA